MSVHRLRISGTHAGCRGRKLSLIAVLGIVACGPSVRKLDETVLYSGPFFELKVVRYYQSLFLSFNGKVAFVACRSARTLDRPGGPTTDPGWVQVRSVPAIESNSAEALRSSAWNNITIVRDTVLIAAEPILSISYDGCRTFRRWDPRGLPDSLLTPPVLPSYCAPVGTVDCSFMSDYVEVAYSELEADPRGSIAFTVTGPRFVNGLKLRVESSDSGRTWQERPFRPPLADSSGTPR